MTLDKISIGPIAYLTGNYPMISHTFILREVQALRRQGANIITCSIRRPKELDFGGEEEIAALSDTYYVLSAARNPLRTVIAHIGALLRSPGRWLSSLGLAVRTRPPGLRALLWQLFYFVEAGVLAEYLRRSGVTHLHNHFANSSCSVAMLTSEISGIPFSFTLHGPAIFFEPKWWRIDEKIARASFVACISYFARSQAMLFSDQAHWSKLKIVHCGVINHVYNTGQHSTFEKRILFIGRLAAVKGVPLLLDAFEAVLATHPDARLTIVGDGEDRKALEKRADQFSDRITFTGYQPQEKVAALLRDADMLVLPSFAEGVPVVLMEAMASGLPVIASRIAGISELVEDGVSGFLIPPGDVGNLINRLQELLADPGLCRRMGEVGRRKVELEFDVDHEAAKLGDLFSTMGQV